MIVVDKEDLEAIVVGTYEPPGGGLILCTCPSWKTEPNRPPQVASSLFGGAVSQEQRHTCSDGLCQDRCASLLRELS